MNKKLVRDLGLGAAMLGSMIAIAVAMRCVRSAGAPSSTPPPEGTTWTGAQAANLHPKVAPPELDRNAFAKLPDECGCALATGRVQLRMYVKGQHTSISDTGTAVYVIHDVALAKILDGGEQLAKFPPLDDVAPNPKTEGFAVRFDLACAGDRLIVADALRVTSWDLAKGTPRRLWSTPRPARNGAVVSGTTLAIECHAARIDGGAVIVDPDLRLGLADGKPAS